MCVYNFWDDNRALSASEDTVRKLKEAQEQQTSTDSEILWSDDMTDPSRDMPAVEIDGYRYIGTITILPLEIELPIMEEWDYTRMKISPCRYSGSVYLDNLILCGHNYRSHFGRLGRLQTNDEVIFTDVEGNVYRYRVAEIDTLAGTAVEEMKAGDWDLTLFTCTLGGASRVTVRCERVER